MAPELPFTLTEEGEKVTLVIADEIQPEAPEPTSTANPAKSDNASVESSYQQAV